MCVICDPSENGSISLCSLCLLICNAVPGSVLYTCSGITGTFPFLPDGRWSCTCLCLFCNIMNGASAHDVNLTPLSHVSSNSQLQQKRKYLLLCVRRRRRLPIWFSTFHHTHKQKREIHDLPITAVSPKCYQNKEWSRLVCLQKDPFYLHFPRHHLICIQFILLGEFVSQ